MSQNHMISFSSATIFGLLEKRYKRFFMDVRLDDGTQVVAHIANTGSMKGLLEPNSPVMLLKSHDPKRKTQYDVYGIKIADTWVGVNTHLPNRLIYEGFLQKHQLLGDIADYSKVQKEVKYGPCMRSKVDFVLSNAQEKKVFVEVKNVTLKVGKKALFPDSESKRAQKHMEDLMAEVKNGHGAWVVFLVQRQDVESFSVAKDIDPEYADLVLKAQKCGVRFKAVCSKLDPCGVFLTHEINVNF